MTRLIDKSALVAEIERRKQVAFGWMETAPNDAIEAEFELCDDILSFIDTLEVKEVPISKDLEEAINDYIGYAPEVDECSFVYGKRHAFKAGAKWKEHHLWKPADGEELPEIDREVIVLTQPYPLEGSEYLVSFAHRPNPNGYDGKSLTTEKVEHYTPKIYDKGGWNIPNVKWWLNCQIPNIED